MQAALNLYFEEVLIQDHEIFLQLKNKVLRQEQILLRFSDDNNQRVLLVLARTYLKLAKQSLWNDLSYSGYVEKGYEYLQKIQSTDILNNELLVLKFQYICLMSIVDKSKSTQQVNIFIELIKKILQKKQLNGQLAGYLAVVAVTSYPKLLSNVERGVLLQIALKKLDGHPCLLEVTDNLQRIKERFVYFPMFCGQVNRFLCFDEGLNETIKLTESWFMDKMSNEFLFKPVKKFTESTHTNKELIAQETIDSYLDNSKKKLSIRFIDKEFIKFIGHLHDIVVTVGTSKKNPSFIINIALQEMGVLDSNFLLINLEKLKEPSVQKELFHKIMKLAQQNDLIVDEDSLKEGLKNFYEDQKSRVGAVTFFRKTYFESFNFNSAFFLLYKASDHSRTYLPQTNQFLPLSNSFNTIKDIIKRSYIISEDINTILSTPEPKDHLRLLCLRMIDDVRNSKQKIMLQIQVMDKKENHAIYAILEPYGDKGIQFVISNGGMGVEFHKPKVITQINAPDMSQETRPHKWLYTDWTMFVEENSIPEGQHIHYKGIFVTDITDSELREGFCKYLMLCCSGPLLAKSPTYKSNLYLRSIYQPSKNNKIKTLINDSQEIDLENTMPKQVMGNCTVYNALHALVYAEALQPAQLFFIKKMLEVGIDDYYTRLTKPQAQSDLTSMFFKKKPLSTQACSNLREDCSM